MRCQTEGAIRRFDLTGKVAWVVGGGGYLGVPICHAMAEHGAHVIIADVKKQAAEKACDLLICEKLSAGNHSQKIL